MPTEPAWLRMSAELTARSSGAVISTTYSCGDPAADQLDKSCPAASTTCPLGEVITPWFSTFGATR